jgi:hypothetical protein
VIGALKKALNPRAHDLASMCAAAAAATHGAPRWNWMRDFEPHRPRWRVLGAHQRRTARIDNKRWPDGFQLYLHSFIVTADGDWAVVQQGMNGASRLARLSRHSAACARLHRRSARGHRRHECRHDHEPRGRARQAGAGALLNIVRDDPSRTLAEVRRLSCRSAPGAGGRCAGAPPRCRAGAGARTGAPGFRLPAAIGAAGARTLQSLALVAEVVHGAATRFDDPARFSLRMAAKTAIRSGAAAVYDESIGSCGVRSTAQAGAQREAGRDEKIGSIYPCPRGQRQPEATSRQRSPTRGRSHQALAPYGAGRSTERAPLRGAAQRQLLLFPS